MPKVWKFVNSRLSQNITANQSSQLINNKDTGFMFIDVLVSLLLIMRWYYSTLLLQYAVGSVASNLPRNR